MKANESPLKRSFAQVASSTSVHFQLSECDGSDSNSFSLTFNATADPSNLSSVKRRPSPTLSFKMPVQTTSTVLPPSFPSFMSVFGSTNEVVSTEPVNHRYHAQTQTEERCSTKALCDIVEEDRPLGFQHRESVSSTTSESADSSPTTTVSTFDNASVTDASPSSSPESPTSISLLCSKSMTLPAHSVIEPVPMAQHGLHSTQLRLFHEPRSVSPGRRARNLKNLSLKMSSQSTRPAISAAAIMETGSYHLSAPPSPAHRPIKTARRRPSNLTILTPGLDRSFTSSIANSISDAVPPTPNVRRSLRHIESSPSLASIFSPTTGPPQGMQLPRPHSRDGMLKMPGAWVDDFSPLSGPPDPLGPVEEEDYNLDSRESTKQDERGYPDGPIKIYDRGVYLYLEPSAEEASRFDVVINVAKEVANPFDTRDTAKDNSVISTLRKYSLASKRQSIIEPQTAVSEVSFHSAFEFVPSDSDSPTTPKAELPQPEYLHVPWDHNSEILDDLQPLCEIIDDRVSKGKSVLIHCQLGVSRSASLVIAYGLYTNRHLDFNSMYEIVKEKSKWVGPNMSLIYQLTDFRSRLSRLEPSKTPNLEWFRFPKNPPQFVQTSPQDSPTTLAEPDPITEAAILIGAPNEEPRVQLRQPPLPLRSLDLQPSHTPVDLLSALRSPTTDTVNPLASPRPLPLREKYQPGNAPFHSFPVQSISDHIDPPSRIRVRYPSVQMDLVLQDVPTSPSILSPHAAGFMASSLSRTLAGDLAGDRSFNLIDPTPVWFDPRSPPQRDEPVIMRNIDEFL